MAVVSCLILSLPGHAENLASEYSPPVREASRPTSLYWGDTHLHTSNSPDAFVSGTTVSPDDAYRFAQGQEVVSSSGIRAKLRRPLDFLAVSDHAEFLGVFPRLKAGDAALLGSAAGQRLKALQDSGDAMVLAKAIENADPRNRPPREVLASIWTDVARTADRHNLPGRFTAFAAYEWTSMPDGNNLHRVVLFKDGAEKVTKALPFSSFDSNDPEALWSTLADYEAKTGGEVLAIPHNGNLSNGLMFKPETFGGGALSPAYARTRARWEPLYEVVQTKGDAESHPILSPTDEFADFERWDAANATREKPKEKWMLQYEYARSALKEGLRQEAALGVNPFKFGLIGSTDIHTGLSSTAEDNFFGKLRNSEPNAARSTNYTGPWETWRLCAGGLAAVWASENTREAIFAALKRREVYATTGSRIMVRFFGGWDFRAADAQRPDYASIGYAKGVPMGGDLIRSSQAKAPTFMIVAAKDPDEANLDRIQIIKGWLDDKGETHERVYDVALSGGRKIDKRTGKAPAVGNTVDVADASYVNSIGAAELSAVWRDPQFNPAQRAFYYARVIEIPKPRWTAYDAKFYKLKLPQQIPVVVQDRAYTSPIWYQP